jgi:transcriptional regulator with XRE-family HTH domain
MPPSKNAHLVEFGRRVRSIRNSRGLSQEELAAVAGLHRTYVGMIERGEKNLTLLNILRVAEALGCAAAELLTAEQ